MATGGKVSTETKRGGLCQICETAQPMLFCNECKQSMCDTCKQRHDKVHSFSTHDVSPVCSQHGLPLTHLCHTCMVGMCIKCILTDHIDHGKEFDSFTDGVQSLRKKSAEEIQNIELREKALEENVKSIEEKLKEGKNMKTALKDLRAAYVDKISKVDNLLNDIEETYDGKGEKILKVLQGLQSEGKALKDMMSFDKKQDLEVVSGYDSMHQKSRQFLQSVDKELQQKFEGLTLQSYDDAHMRCFKEAEIPVAQGDLTTSQAKLVLSYVGHIKNQLKGVTDVKVVSNDSVIIADHLLKRAFQVNKEGQLLQSYRPLDENKGNIFSIAVKESYCYLLQPEAITKVKLGNVMSKESIALGLKYNDYNCVDNDGSFLISDYTEKAVFRCNLDKMTKDKVLQESNLKPKYISRTPAGNYVVSFYSCDSIHEYSAKWQLIKTIGSEGSGDGQLKSPRGMDVIQSGHLLVADYDNDRVTCFNPDGSFCKHILTAEDGIKDPWAVAVCWPLLWVGGGECLKCFELV